MVAVLEPFKFITNTFGDDEYLTASIANYLIKNILNTVRTCETDFNFIKTIAFCIDYFAYKTTILHYYKAWKLRWKMKSSVFSKTTALDPRFHLLKFISDKHKILIWEELKTDLCEMNLKKQKIRNVVIDQDKSK